MNIDGFKDKKNWAVIGSVHDKNKFAYRIYNFLKLKGYRVFPVDPKASEIDGEVSYSSLKDIKEEIDAVDMVINPVKGETFLCEAAELNIKYVWFQPGAESEKLISIAKNHDMEVVEKKCVMVEFK